MARGLSAREVHLIFSAIDTDGDGKLDIHELRSAFRDAGAVSQAFLGAQGGDAARFSELYAVERVRERKRGCARFTYISVNVHVHAHMYICTY